MNAQPDPDVAIESWLQDEARDGAPERLLAATRNQLALTRQRRAWWPARRFADMNNVAKLATAVAAVVVLAIIGYNLLPKSGGVGGPSPTTGSTPSPTPGPTPTESPTPSAPPALLDGPLAAGTYSISAPEDGFFSCPKPVTPPCSDTIRLLLTVPDGWTGGGEDVTKGDNAPPGGASLLFTRGAPLYVDPCAVDATIPAGPTVDDFANALADHPQLDVTAPVDVALAGYSGKYVDLQVPADITACPFYRPWEPGLYAQGPSQRWHLWILDVGGQRVVVQSTDYAGTSVQDRSELQAIVDSIQFQP